MPLTSDTILSIRAECFSDDIDVDFAQMRNWTELELREYFESGGSQALMTQECLMASMGACIPNAVIPDVPLTEAEGVPVSTTSDDGSVLVDAGRIFCVSDLHTDHEANMLWCKALGNFGDFTRDVLIIAGDVTASQVLLRETFTVLVATFKAVFYVPGNHDLWVKGRGLAGGLHIRPTPIDSMGKLHEIMQLCADLGVRTTPGYAAGAIIVPIYSWYHASWDTEPDIRGWEGIPPVEAVMMDYHLCTWPPPLSPHNDSIAAEFDAMNDRPWGRTRGCGIHSSLNKLVGSLQSSHPGAPLITFSHFVPKLELNPEKRYLFYPPLAKACGSVYLAQRIDSLRPAVHVFGHTHFGWVRMQIVKPLLCYPQLTAGSSSALPRRC